MVIVARVWFSSRTATPSFASTAWCSPSDQRRPCISRPVNSSTIRTCPSRTPSLDLLLGREGLVVIDLVHGVRDVRHHEQRRVLRRHRLHALVGEVDRA